MRPSSRAVYQRFESRKSGECVRSRTGSRDSSFNDLNVGRLDCQWSPGHWYLPDHRHVGRRSLDRSCGTRRAPVISSGLNNMAAVVEPQTVVP